MSSSRVTVPQKIYGDSRVISDRINPTPINFTRSRYGTPISVKEAMNPQLARTIDWPDFVDNIGNGYPYRKIYVTWPGYKGLYINYTLHGNVTRAQLLMEVAKQVAYVLDRAGHSPCSKKYELYKAGAGLVTISNVYIISLVNTVEDTWQVELELSQ